MSKDSDRGGQGAPVYIAEPLRGLAVPIADLHPDPSNARKHDDKNIEAIIGSLHRFGQRIPIVVQRQGMVVRAGNGRLEAAKRMGWTHLAAVVVDESSVEATAYAIADNRTAELAEWDDETLAALLQSLPEDVLPASGFDDDDLKELLNTLTPDVVEDEAPEPLPEAVTRTGDVWLLGSHRLLCGDSTKAGDVALCVGDALADTFTDPPYGIGYQYAEHNDSKEDNGGLWDAVFKLAPGAKVWTPGLMNLGREIVKHPDARVLVWHKGYAQAGNGLGGASTWEPVLCLGIKGGRLPNDYLHFSTDREPGLRESHPCPKPVALYAHLIEHLSGRGVYEPFSGSGTTIIACQHVGRTCCAIEITPVYVDVAVRRWEKLTGKQATLESTGKTWRETAEERGVNVNEPPPNQ